MKQFHPEIIRPPKVIFFFFIFLSFLNVLEKPCGITCANVLCTVGSRCVHDPKQCTTKCGTFRRRFIYKMVPWIICFSNGLYNNW